MHRHTRRTSLQEKAGKHVFVPQGLRQEGVLHSLFTFTHSSQTHRVHIAQDTCPMPTPQAYPGHGTMLRNSRVLPALEQQISFNSSTSLISFNSSISMSFITALYRVSSVIRRLSSGTKHFFWKIHKHVGFFQQFLFCSDQPPDQPFPVGLRVFVLVWPCVVCRRRTSMRVVRCVCHAVSVEGFGCRGVHKCTLIDCCMSAMLEDCCLFVLTQTARELF